MLLPSSRAVRRNTHLQSFLTGDWLESDGDEGEAPAVDPFAELKAYYRTPDGISDFVRDILNAKPETYQADVLRDLVLHKRIAVRALHGVGKTMLSACVVLWGICCFDTDVKIITTASAWRQVTHFTWPEIKLWASRANFGRLGIQIRRNKELLELSLKLPQKEAFAVVSDDPALIEGAHASTLIYVFDEAKAIPNGTWDAAEGAFSNAGADTHYDAYALAISTPGKTSGRFYEICSRKPGLEDWHTRHITLTEALAAGRVSQTWVEQRRLQWGENSPVYKNRVLGEFDDSADENVIPLAWVEQSHQRWRDCEGKGVGRTSYGVDPADSGPDKSTIAKLVGRVIEWVQAHAREELMETTGRITAVAKRNQHIAVDTIGVGAGVYSRLAELEYQAHRVNAGERPLDPYSKQPLMDSTHTFEFVNMRAFLWWMLREALDPTGEDPIALPDIPELTGDLTAPMYWHRSDGKIQIESKDDLRLRIGRSTDFADAVALALWAGKFKTAGWGVV